MSQKIWTPSKRVTERELEIAFRLFIELWKVASEKFQPVERGINYMPAELDEPIYRRCIAAALTISRIEEEEPKR